MINIDDSITNRVFFILNYLHKWNLKFYFYEIAKKTDSFDGQQTENQLKSSVKKKQQR